MATFDDSKRDAADLAKGMSEDTTFNTRYGVNPKKSFPMAIREIETSGAATVNQIQTDAANAIATLNTSRGFRIVGDFASGFTYELANDVAIDGSGNYWVYADVNALPVVVAAGTTPSAPTYTQTTFSQASAVTTTAGINTQQFIDSFELKIFQSPTDNLTKVTTFAGGVGVVYEVRKTSDNSLATIYSDKDGITSIPQNGTANVSNGDAEVVFYIADGDYKVTINAISAGLKAAKSKYIVSASSVADGSFKVGDKLTLKDRYDAPFVIKAGTVFDGYSTLYAGVGQVAVVDLDGAHSGVNAGWFGIKVNDFDARVENYNANHSILKFIFTNLKTGSFNPLYGGVNAEMVANIPLKYPSGLIYLEGNSPFHIPASEYPSVFDKKRGIVFEGNGTDSTIFEIIKPAGYVGTINYYDNMSEQDGSGGLGGWDKVWFRDMTLRTPYWIAGLNSSKAKRAINDKYNGFRKNSGGFEKFFRFESVLFQGFDTVDTIEGVSNVDENHYHNCRFELIRDNVLLLKNPESVGHRYTDCDFEPIIGNVVKAEQGGFVAINGGSIILYPQYDDNGPIVATESRAIFNVEASGADIDARAGVYIARDITLEKYDTKQQLTRISQVGTVPVVGDDALTPRFPASSVDVQFHSCSFRTDTKQPDDTVNIPGNHNVIVINGDVLANVTLTDCALNTRHFYAFQGSNTEYGKGSKVKFVRPRLLWDPSKNNVEAGSWEGGTLADRCNTSGMGEMSCCGASAITTPKWFNTKRNFELDFLLGSSGVSTPTLTNKTAVIKRSGEAMVTTSESYAELGNSLALYDGAEILGFEIRVPQVGGSATTGSIKILSEELTSADPNSFKELHSEAIDESVGLKKHIDLGYAGSYEISSGNRLHVKWGSFSDPSLNTATEVRVLFK